MDEQKEILLRQYLDGELDENRQRELLHMMADDPEMRSMLQFELKVRNSAGSLRDADSFSVPEHFTGNVMEAIEAREKDTAQTPLMERITKMLEPLWAPREIQFRPAYAVAALVVIIALFAMPYMEDMQGPEKQLAGQTAQKEFAYQDASSERGGQVWTRFVYIDKDAESVAVAGDFSDWDPVNLDKKTLNGQEVWTGMVPMQKGEHRYMFVKNGNQWVTDPLATNYEEDGFGNKNAVIYL